MVAVQRQVNVHVRSRKKRIRTEREEIVSDTVNRVAAEGAWALSSARNRAGSPRASASSEKVSEFVLESVVEGRPSAQSFGSARVPMMTETINGAPNLGVVVTVTEHEKDQIRARHDKSGH